MPRDRNDDERRSRFEDDWNDDDRDEWDEESADDASDYSRALTVRAESDFLPAIDDDDDLDLPAIAGHPDPLIIPGEGLPVRVSGKRRKRPLTMQLLVVSVASCVLLAALFSFSPLGDIGASSTNGAFTALANAIVISKQATYFLYRARSGDNFDTIAARFGVQVGGIYELNHLYAGDEAQVGMIYEIPTNPTFGSSFIPPLPPGVTASGYALPEQNIPNATCLFCAIAGRTNGPSGVCAPPYSQIPNILPQQYSLMPPEAGDTPASHWVRGFTAFHSGVDLSTGVYGSPLHAAQDGVIIFAGWDSGGGGYSIKINHCGGLASSYSHMEGILPGLKFGTIVHRGQVIGYQGDSGNSFGTHVHYMLWWDNIPFDALCAFGSLDGYAQSYHYGNCPPNLLQGTAWYP